MVSTTIGAEGIDTQPGDNILLADDPVAYAAAVVQLLTDGELRERLRRNGRLWVEQHYNWQTIYPQVGALNELAKN
jgi:glycosyltransferase involved in cell wall biosynthesis